MATDLIVNATPFEISIALVEYGTLVEYYLERPAEKGLISNIYKGRVKRVLPGMQAAFVDVGLERTGFLYVDDVMVPRNGDSQSVADCALLVDEEGCCSGVTTESLPRRIPGLHIEELLVEGQEILVQICKDPIGTKGARLTCNITLPCRNVVFMPMTNHIGISRKIEDEETREKLKSIIEELRPADSGFIVRTVGENASREELEADMEFLLHLWDEVKDSAGKAQVPSLVYEDLDITLRMVRDIFSPEVDRLIVDNEQVYNRILKFVETFAPHLRDRVVHYKEDTPVFDIYGLEMDVNRALDQKIWLRCGGYIIIENTEALTVIDVNTGRYVGKNDLEETIFKTNMEAVREIAYQLRLRNIGGIIIIDFIDMEQEAHREEIFRALKEAVKKDKSRVNILKVSEFGLVQMTRKRSSEDLSHLLCEPCHYCHGEGVLKSRRTICYEILRKISRNALKMREGNILVNVHPQVAGLMLKEEAEIVHNLEDEIGRLITVVPDQELHSEKYEIIWQKG
ncbi:MAG: Rne/Rng family ribonuclease [Proteobacteria bacterium]|nr:Rne/Rng family ribonuclease [Pseudomonadota bacterium]MBU1687283.1 Rne/Rng family ribonuclease [Pseudomonadota bacterium]